ncbi:MAG: tRNA dimethylallyltransferase [Bacteroidetes bacterium]|nr:MAG: tRNA dimethylallyltransferase [Bacteroidota bacterium]
MVERTFLYPDYPILLVIAGPTAVGKTSVAIDVAKHFGCDIISADSRQFYRELVIGTAVPDAGQLAEVKHHMVGNLSVTDSYNVSRFEQDVLKILPDLFSRNPIAVMVGGSGLYIKAVCEGIDDLPDADAELRNTLHSKFENEGLASLRAMLLKLDPDYSAVVDPANPNRIIRALEVCLSTGKTYTSFRNRQPLKRDFRIFRVGLELPRAELHHRINSRVDQMMNAGLEAEARSLYPLRQLNALNTVGYRELFDYFEDKCSLTEAVEKIKTNTRRYARRQMTWFRKEREMIWSPPDAGEVIRIVSKAIENQQ